MSENELAVAENEGLPFSAYDGDESPADQPVSAPSGDDSDRVTNLVDLETAASYDINNAGVATYTQAAHDVKLLRVKLGLSEEGGYTEEVYAAVKKYQESKGLKANGKPTRSTLLSLDLL